MAEENKPEWHNKIAKYIGKTLDKQGEKNGKSWVIWKLLFESGKKNPDWYRVFDTLKGFNTTDAKGKKSCNLKEGEYYEVSYFEKPFISNGIEKIGKEVKLIKPSSKDKATQSKPVTVAAPKGPRLAEGWVKFAEEYDAQMKDNPKSGVMHMLGAYVANNMTDEFKDIILLCKKHFNKE